MSDISLGDIGTNSAGLIDKDSWMKAFSKFDHDGDGELSDDDLEHARYGVTSGSDVMRRWNLTKQDLRKALALMARRCPETAEALLVHEPLIVELAWTGVPVPSDAPEVSISGIAEAGSEKGELDDVEAQMTECQSKMLRFVFESISFFVTLASGGTASWLLNAMEKAKSGVLRRITAATFSQLTHLAGVFVTAVRESNIGQASEAMVQVFRELWDKDIIMTILDEARKEMTWWDWFTTAATIIATMTLWFASGGLALAASISFTVLAAGNLIQAAIMVAVHCH